MVTKPLTGQNSWEGWEDITALFSTLMNSPGISSSPLQWMSSLPIAAHWGLISLSWGVSIEEHLTACLDIPCSSVGLGYLGGCHRCSLKLLAWAYSMQWICPHLSNNHGVRALKKTKTQKPNKLLGSFLTCICWMCTASPCFKWSVLCCYVWIPMQSSSPKFFLLKEHLAVQLTFITSS